MTEYSLSENQILYGDLDGQADGVDILAVYKGNDGGLKIIAAEDILKVSPLDSEIPHFDLQIPGSFNSRGFDRNHFIQISTTENPQMQDIELKSVIDLPLQAGHSFIESHILPDPWVDVIWHTPYHPSA